jgi:hypothetical protein
MALIECAAAVPRGRAGFAAWRALSSFSSLTWGFWGTAWGLVAGGWVAYLAGGEFGTVLVVTGILGLGGAAAGVGVGHRVRCLATQGCERSARRVRWVTRYGWPAWLKAVSLLAVTGVVASVWGFTTIY